MYCPDRELRTSIAQTVPGRLEKMWSYFFEKLSMTHTRGPNPYWTFKLMLATGESKVKL